MKPTTIRIPEDVREALRRYQGKFLMAGKAAPKLTQMILESLRDRLRKAGVLDGGFGVIEIIIVMSVIGIVFAVIDMAR